MISRIETIPDIIKCMEFLSTLDGVTPGQFTNMIATLNTLKDTHDYPLKICCKCRKVYPDTSDYFDWSGQGRTGRHATCKDCRRKYQKRYTRIRRQETEGDWSPEYLAEVNRVRAQENLPPLSIPAHRTPSTRKPGRPPKAKTPETPQLPPKPGEKW